MNKKSNSEKKQVVQNKIYSMSENLFIQAEKGIIEFYENDTPVFIVIHGRTGDGYNVSFKP